jgi:hypothetical protein
VKELITRGLLSFVAVDGIYLFICSGMVSSLKFAALKELLIQHLTFFDATTGKTFIPILFMMATCSTNIINYLELLSRLPIDTNLNYLWPEPLAMHHQHVYLFL